MTVLDDTRIEEDATTGVRTGTTRRRRDPSRTPADRATRSKAAQRALDRRRRRAAKNPRLEEPVQRVGKASAVQGHSSSVRRRGLRSRVTSVPFVVPVIGLFVAGLALSLLLSTKAAQDSYRLGVERAENQSLMDRRDSLKRDFESGDSAPELSDKASRLGMIPARDPARMIVGANGKSRIVGDPEPAQGKPMGTINPSDAPDPVSKIDKSKVDDSRGLPGGSESSPQTSEADQSSGATTNSESGRSSEPAAPATSPGAPSPSAPSAATSPAAPAPAIPLNPNVLPSSTSGTSNPAAANTGGNPPGGNSR